MVRPILKTDELMYEKLGSTVNPNFHATYNLDELLKYDHNQILVEEHNGELNGFIHLIVSKEQADIANIVVREDLRKQGIGKKLLEKAIETLDLKEIFLEVRESNQVALNFYNHTGFKEIRRIKNYYGNEDAIVMKWVK